MTNKYKSKQKGKKPRRDSQPKPTQVLEFTDEDESDYQNDLKNFEATLISEGLEIVESAGDGNCLFRSVSQGLKGNHHSHMEYR